jgi:shikimate kinase
VVLQEAKAWHYVYVPHGSLLFRCLFNILGTCKERTMKSDRLMRNLVITGFSGTGKSRVAAEVARRLRWGLVDTDDEIVRASGKAIAEIFRQDGEAKFRELERETISKACRQSRTVISIGGGAIVDRQNHQLLVSSGLVVCLEAKAETIHERLFREAACGSGTEVRPLLAADNPLERIRQLKAERQPYYADVDWTVQTDESEHRSGGGGGDQGLDIAGWRV